EIRPATRIYAAEPATAAPLAASLAAGRPVYFEGWTASFVDGAGGKSVLPTMWPMLSGLSGSIVVSLAQVAAAMKFVAGRVHLIRRLEELAVDLWWSWHPEARAVFRWLDYGVWRATAHNPVRMLWILPRPQLEIAAEHPGFLALYDRALAVLDETKAAHNTWW